MKSTNAKQYLLELTSCFQEITLDIGYTCIQPTFPWLKQTKHNVSWKRPNAITSHALNQSCK